MPTYAYVCADCGHAFDAAQSFTDDSLTVCPECSGRLRKQFGAVGVVFKGSGFYKTDSRTTGEKGSSSSSNNSSGTSSSSNGSSGGATDGGTTTSSTSSESSTSSSASSTSSTAS
ncbi:FmdB family zinc ribbon protein [Janibacter corallicola]|uniref:FmdB family zinc ribbon protein n=1 Tax=Janibacter corallicola TaxID=415212 RepID=UPI000A011E33|nr:FmdB family zinc ribbon protein [Janibacter corallicola]